MDFLFLKKGRGFEPETNHLTLFDLQQFIIEFQVNKRVLLSLRSLLFVLLFDILDFLLDFVFSLFCVEEFEEFSAFIFLTFEVELNNFNLFVAIITWARDCVNCYIFSSDFLGENLKNRKNTHGPFSLCIERL